MQVIKFQHILIFTLTLALVNTNCGENQVLFIKDNNEIECRNCPNDCAICYRSIGQEIECAYCDFGFYKDQNGQCKSCFENCVQCFGPELSQCAELQKQFYYDDNAKPPQIKKCSQEGCLYCSDDKCVECDKKFYETPIETNSFIDDEIYVQCKECNIDNCLICQDKSDFDVHNYIECILCDQGYGLIDNKCQRCIENCAYCEDSSDNCDLCNGGYIWDSKQKKCTQAKIENCFKMKGDKCKICESHFTKDIENNTCVSCASVIDKCNFCSRKKDNFVCESCLAGYMLNDQGECSPCSENCIHCNSQKCLNCKQGMFYDEQQQKCEICTLDNCDKCLNKQQCETCLDNFYLDENQICQKCKNNCLQCTQNGEKCLSCPVNYYNLEEEFTSDQQQTNNILNIFMGFLGLLENQPVANIEEWTTKNSCVKQCPQSIEGEKVSIDHLERRCVVQLEESDPIVNLPKLQKQENTQNSMKQLLNSYQKEIKKLQKVSNEKQNQIYSEECNFNGTLEYIITGYLEYYICICNKGYLGDNCEISYQLFQSTQKKLQEILKVLERNFFNYSQKQKKNLLDTILLVKQFKYGRSVAAQITKLLENFIEKDKEIENFQSLYAIYDSVILQIYDQLEDQKKYQQAPIFMSMDSEAEKEKLINLMQNTFQKLFVSIQDHKFENSFLQNVQNDQKNYNTFSFKIAEYKMKDIQNMNNLIVPTPNIDSAQKIQTPTQVSLQFKQQNDKQLVSHLQLINLSAQLFQNYFQNTESICASNVLFFKIIDPEDKNHQFHDVKVDTITIQFPLLFLPPQQNLQERLQCIGFDFYSTFDDIIGQLSLQDQGGNFQKAMCKFDIDQRFKNKNIFFAIKTNIRSQLNFQT